MKSKESVEPDEHVSVRFVDGTGVWVWFDEQRMQLTRGKKAVHLTPSESGFLKTFVSHPDTVLSQVALNYSVHPDDLLPETARDLYTLRNSVNSCLSRLRGKLAQVGLSARLESVYGGGFLFSSK